MEQISLNEHHINVIHQYLDGEVSNFGATEYQIKYLTEVIQMADKRFNEYPEAPDDGGDTIRWLWEEYQKQESNGEE